MGWNDPEDDKNNKKKDPWSGKDGAPPDLDEAFRNLQRKIRSIIGGNKKNNDVFGKGTDNDDGGAGILFGLVVFVACLFWFLSGFFVVGPAEEAAILRFGKYVDKVGPGMHWIPRFVETKYVRDVAKLSKFTYSAQMLTKDENIVQVSISVIYRIGNIEHFLFNVADPVESLQQATASSLRQIVGHTSLDEIITIGREIWGQRVEELLRSILDEYKAGIVVVSVSPQPARAPEKVQDAFDDAIIAQEDEKRFMEKARAYKEKVLPIAKGKAERLISEAEADAAEWVLQAEGGVAEFLALLPQYRLSPEVVRERMYLDSMEKVLSQTSKILVDGKSGNLLYLPLERLLANNQAKKAALPSLLPSDKAHDFSNSTPTDYSPTTQEVVDQLRHRKTANRFGSRF